MIKHWSVDLNQGSILNQSDLMLRWLQPHHNTLVSQCLYISLPVSLPMYDAKQWREHCLKLRELYPEKLSQTSWRDVLHLECGTEFHGNHIPEKCSHYRILEILCQFHQTSLYQLGHVERIMNTMLPENLMPEEILSVWLRLDSSLFLKLTTDIHVLGWLIWHHMAIIQLVPTIFFFFLSSTLLIKWWRVQHKQFVKIHAIKWPIGNYVENLKVQQEVSQQTTCIVLFSHWWFKDKTHQPAICA